MERAPAGALRALGALPPYFKFSWGPWGPKGPNPLFLYLWGPRVPRSFFNCKAPLARTIMFFSLIWLWLLLSYLFYIKLFWVLGNIIDCYNIKLMQRYYVSSNPWLKNLAITYE